MSVGTVITLGYGSFSTVNFVPTLGYGNYGAVPASSGGQVFFTVVDDLFNILLLGLSGTFYVAEDGTTFYVAEDGTSYYIPEA